MKITALLALFFFAQAALAVFPGGSKITVSGRLLDPSQNPVTGTVAFQVNIFDPAGTCLLYSENMGPLNLSGSNGNFELKLGSSAGSTPWTLAQALDNKNSFSGAGCPSYTPTATDGRSIVIQFTDSSGAHTLSGIEMNSVPRALYAQSADTLQGLSSANLLQVNTTGAEVLSQANLENIFSTSNYSSLVSLLSGGSALYSKPAANGTTPLATVASPASPSPGQIWYDSGSVKYYDGSGTKTLSTAGSGITTNIVAGSGLSGGPITDGTGTLSVDTGTTAGKIVALDAAGKLPAVSGAALTSINGSAITSGTIGGTTAINTTGAISTSNIYGTNVGAQTVKLFDSANTNSITLKAPPSFPSYTLTFPSVAPTAGQVLSSNASGTFAWVAAGSSPTGAASGDLSGSYPSPKVIAIQNTSVDSTAPITAGQVLRYDGTKYTPNFVSMADLRSTITGASALNSCLASQTLTWSSATDNLACSTINVSGTNFGSQSQNFVFAGPATGGSGSPSFRNLTMADLPASVSPWAVSGSNISFTTGNVGIGTTPSQKLHIAGGNLFVDNGNIVTSSNQNSTVATSQLTFQRTRNTATAPANTVSGDWLGAINFFGYNGGSLLGAQISSAVDATPSGGVPGSLVFATGNASGAMNTQMTITSVGNVGIGTTSPAAKLDVAGGVRAAGFTSTACPTNWTLIQPGGTEGPANFCVITTVQSAANWGNAVIACGAMQGHLCGIQEYIFSCASGLLASSTAWTDGLFNSSVPYSISTSNCGNTPSFTIQDSPNTFSTNHPFRCCAH